ncbi:diacylglycerol kinase family protein [Schlesneria paludicola]|uniref:diacylglycerol kinase family protein n=1 Tax=Schlesneria paludicola TaxID=360056 RepID=UPI00029A1436|nr:diacylglycerol kinase family protein [Schlesneria paludicola]
MKQPSFGRSLLHAINGLAFTVRTQRNAKIHVVFGSLVLIMAVWLQLDLQQISILILTIGGVIAGETINTTVEAVVDLLSPEFHERAKIAKDVSAGAVLILSLAAILVGLLTMGPPLWERVSQFTRGG